MNNNKSFASGRTYETPNSSINVSKEEKKLVKRNAYSKLKEDSKDFCRKQLIPQFAKLTSSKMFQRPIDINFFGEHKDVWRKVLKEIKNNLDFNAVFALASERASIGSNAVVVFQKETNRRFGLYLALNSVYSINPATREFDYLFTVQYRRAGNLVYIITQTWENKKLRTQLLEGNDGYNPSKELKGEELKKDIESNSTEIKFNEVDETKKAKADKIKKDLRIDENLFAERDYEDIPAVLLLGRETEDFKGLPDLDLESPYVKKIDLLYFRLMWDLTIIKPRYIINNEMGMNSGMKDHGDNSEMDEMVESGYAIKNNDFGFPLGDAGAGINYVDASNQNATIINSLFNENIKKLFEHSGFFINTVNVRSSHSTDLQILQDREAEDRSFGYKVSIAEKAIIKLIYKMFQVVDDVKEKPNVDEIRVIIRLKNVISVKDNLQTELMKINANVSSRSMLFKEMHPNLSDEAIKELLEEIMQENNDDRYQEIIAKPVEDKFTPPQLNNTFKKKNNQSKAFLNQLEDKNKKGGDKGYSPSSGEKGTPFSTSGG